MTNKLLFSLPEALASCILSHTQQPVLLGMKNLGNYNIEQAIYLIVLFEPFIVWNRFKSPGPACQGALDL